MKKCMLTFLLFLMFIPFVVNAETCDTDKISISSITMQSKSNSVKELDEASVRGKNINLNLSMSEVGDNIEYKIVVKNDSNEDYLLDKNSFNLSSDYIEYTFDSEDDTNIVKANSSRVVYLNVKYKNEVPADAFESGTYNDNKSMTVNLSTGDTINVPDTLKNPNTGVYSYIIILFIISLIILTTYQLLRKKEYSKFMILIIGTVIIIPMSIYALCKCDINIISKVQINYLKSSFCILDENYQPVHIPINSGMTWNDLFSYSKNNLDNRFNYEVDSVCSYNILNCYRNGEDDEFDTYLNDSNYYKLYRFSFENTLIGFYVPNSNSQNSNDYHWEGIDSYVLQNDIDKELHWYSINSNLDSRIDEYDSGICYCVGCG